MLLQVGRRAASEDVVDLLVECHGRIRRFLAMARTLAAAPPGVPRAEIAATAAQIVRYFSTSFALHVEDEEVDIAPVIATTAAARVHDEHDQHARAVADLVARCGELAQHPDHLPALAAALAATVDELAVTLEAHLAFEEQTVFPEIRALPAARRDAIRDAMRARRDRQLGAKPA